MLVQVVEVGQVLQVAGLHQGFDGRRSEPVDIHRLLGREIDQVAGQLCRTVDAGAADIRAIAVPFGGRPANRAVGRDPERRRLSGSLLAPHRQNSGDDVARLLDQDRIADPDIQVIDIVLVVQCGPANPRSGYLNGLEQGHGGQSPGPADLDLDVEDAGLLLFRRVLVGHGPARHLAGRAQQRARSQVIQFDNRPVDAVRQGETPCADRLDSGPDLVLGTAQRPAGADRKALIGQPRQAFGMRSEGHAVG